MKKYPLGNYGLSIVLGILFLACWAAQTYYGWLTYKSEEQQHGHAAKFWGEDSYRDQWLASTMENWQSEFLQLFSFVILTAILIHRGSHESKDADDAQDEQLKRIEKKLDELMTAYQAQPKPRA